MTDRQKQSELVCLVKICAALLIERHGHSVTEICTATGLSWTTVWKLTTKKGQKYITPNMRFGTIQALVAACGLTLTITNHEVKVGLHKQRKAA